MRYMLLIYSQERPSGTERDFSAHFALMREAESSGIFVAAEPLAATASATTVRRLDGKTLITDGPFAETKEHLAGYYILDCKDLDEAIEWAAKIPHACSGSEGVEIRPMPGLTSATAE